MFSIFLKKKKQQCLYEKKLLKDFSKDELLTLLENNENLDALELSGICSEILRRMKIEWKN